MKVYSLLKEIKLSQKEKKRNQAKSMKRREQSIHHRSFFKVIQSRKEENPVTPEDTSPIESKMDLY